VAGQPSSSGKKKKKEKPFPIHSLKIGGTQQYSGGGGLEILKRGGEGGVLGKKSYRGGRGSRWSCRYGWKDELTINEGFPADRKKRELEFMD